MQPSDEDLLSPGVSAANTPLRRRMSQPELFAVQQAAVRDMMGPADVDFPADDEPVDAAIRRRAVGSLNVLHCRPAPSSIRRSRRHVAQQDSESFLCLLPQRGTASLKLGDRECVVKPGEMVLISNTLPAEMISRQDYASLVIRMPAQALRLRLPDPHGVTCLPLPTDRGVAQLAAGYLQNLADATDDISAAMAPLLADKAMDLIAYSYLAEMGRAPADRTLARAALYSRAMEFIDLNLCDGELSPATVARALGISERYLRDVFAAGDDTVAACILNKRLQAATRILKNPLLRQQPIYAIAYELGFSSPSHFSIAFKRAFGLSPGAFRGQTELGGAEGIIRS